MEQVYTKEVGLVCTLYAVHTKNIISVFIKKINRYVILRKDADNNWWLVHLKFRKYFKKEIQEITAFKKPLMYWNGYFLFQKRTIISISKNSFSLFKKIPYFEEGGIGQIKKEYLISV